MISKFKIQKHRINPKSSSNNFLWSILFHNYFSHFNHIILILFQRNYQFSKYNLLHMRKYYFATHMNNFLISRSKSKSLWFCRRRIRTSLRIQRRIYRRMIRLNLPCWIFKNNYLKNFNIYHISIYKKYININNHYYDNKTVMNPRNPSSIPIWYINKIKLKNTTS